MAVMRFTSEFSGAEQAVNVWHFLTPGAASTTLANECIVKVDTFFEAIKTWLSPGTWTHGTRVTTVDLLPNVVVPATPLTTTTTGTTHAPKSVAAGISWQTAFIGRSFRGRSYIGPLTNASIASSGTAIVGPTQTDLVTAAGALRAVTAGGAQLCIWSEKLQQANVVVGAAVPILLRTQRRRLT